MSMIAIDAFVGAIRAGSRFVLWIVLVHGCEAELPPVVAEGERVRIAPLDDVRVCAGSVATFERYLNEVEARVGTTRDDTLTVYWGASAGPRFCSSGRAEACASPSLGRIFTDLANAPHEMVHHVAYERAHETNPLFEEGVAVHLSGDCVRQSMRPTDQPPWLLDLAMSTEATDQHYVYGGSLVGFIANRWELDAALALRDAVPGGVSEEQFERAVQDVLGLPHATLDALWRTASPHEVCGPRFPRSNSAPLEYDFAPMTIEATLDCSQLDTEGPLDRSLVYNDGLSEEPLEPGMYRHVELLIPTPTDVELELEGPDHTRAVLYGRCWRSSFATADSLGRIELDAGDRDVWTLGACVWSVFLISERIDGVVDLSLHVRPT